MASTQELFNYVLTDIEKVIDEKIEFVKEQGLKKEIRNLFKPEMQFWLLKILIAEHFGAEVNDENVLETIDSFLR